MLDTSIFLVTFVFVLALFAGYAALAFTSIINVDKTQRSIVVNTSLTTLIAGTNLGVAPATALWRWTFANVGLAILFAFCIYVHVEMDANEGHFLTSAQDIYFDINQVWNYAIARPLGAVIGAIYATLVPISNLVLYAPISAFWGTLKVLGECGDPYALFHALAQIPVAIKLFITAWIDVFSSTAPGSSWKVSPLVVGPAVRTLQNGTLHFMQHAECLCEFFAPTMTTVTNVVTSNAVANAAQAAVNVPWRILQFVVQLTSSGYAFTVTPVFTEYREFFYNAGLFLDDVLEGVLNVLRMQTHLGSHIKLPRPFIGMAAMRAASGATCLMQIPIDVIGAALGSGKSMLDVTNTKMAHTQFHLAILALAGGVNSVRNLVLTGQPGTEATMQCDYYSYDFFKDNNIHGSIAEKCFCDDTSCGPSVAGHCTPNGLECQCHGKYVHSIPGDILSTCVQPCTERTVKYPCNNAANQNLDSSLPSMGTCSKTTGQCTCTTGYALDRFGTCTFSAVGPSKDARPECIGIELAQVGHPIPCTMQHMGLAAVGMSYTAFNTMRQFWTNDAPWKILETIDGIWYNRMDSVTCAYRKENSKWDQTIDPDDCKCDIPGEFDKHGVNFDPYCGLPTLNANVYSHLDALAFYAGSLAPYTIYGIPVPIGGIGWIPSFLNDNLGVITTTGVRALVESVRIATHVFSGMISYALSVPNSFGHGASGEVNLLQMPINCEWGVAYDGKNIGDFYTDTTSFTAVQAQAKAQAGLPNLSKDLQGAIKRLTTPKFTSDSLGALEAMNRFYKYNRVQARADAMKTANCKQYAYDNSGTCATSNNDEKCTCNVDLEYKPWYKCTCIAWYPGVNLESEDMHGYYHSEKTSQFYHQEMPWCNSMFMEWQYYRAMEMAVGAENLFARLDSHDPMQTKLESPCYEDNKKNQFTLGDTTAVIKMFQPAEPGGNIYRFPGGVQRNNYRNETLCKEMQQFAQPQWILFDPHGGSACSACGETQMTGFTWFLSENEVMLLATRQAANTKLQGNYIQNGQIGAVIDGTFQPLRNDTYLAKLNSQTANLTNAKVLNAFELRGSMPLPTLSLLTASTTTKNFTGYAKHFFDFESTDPKVIFPTNFILKNVGKSPAKGGLSKPTANDIQDNTNRRRDKVLTYPGTGNFDQWVYTNSFVRAPVPDLNNVYVDQIREPVLKLTDVYKHSETLNIKLGHFANLVGPVITDRVVLLHPETCGYAARNDQLIFRPCAHNCHTLGGQDICWCNVTIPTDFTCNVGQLLRQHVWTGIGQARRITTPIISAMGFITGGMTMNVAQGLCDMSRIIGTSAGALASLITLQQTSPMMTDIRHKLATLIFAGMDAAFMMPTGKLAAMIPGMGVGDEASGEQAEEEVVEELDEVGEELTDVQKMAQSFNTLNKIMFGDSVPQWAVRRRLEGGDYGKGKQGLDNGAVMLTEFQAFLQQLFPEAMTGKARPKGQESNALAILSSFVANMYFLWFKFACIETCAVMDGLQKVVFGSELDSKGAADIIPAIEDFIDICIELLDDVFTELVVVLASVVTGFFGMMFVGKPSMGHWLENALRILWHAVALIETNMMTFVSMVIDMFPSNVRPIVSALMTTLCVSINVPGAGIIDVVNGAGSFLGLGTTPNLFKTNLNQCMDRKDLFMSLAAQEAQFSQVGDVGFLRRLAEKDPDAQDAIWKGDTFCARYGRKHQGSVGDEWIHECVKNRHYVEILRNATGKDYWEWTLMDDWKEPVIFFGKLAHGAMIYYTAGELQLKKWKQVGYPVEAVMDVVYTIRGLNLPGFEAVEAAIPSIYADYATKDSAGFNIVDIIEKVKRKKFPNLFDQDWDGFNTALYDAGSSVVTVFMPTPQEPQKPQEPMHTMTRRLQEALTIGSPVTSSAVLPKTTRVEGSCDAGELCTNCKVLDEFVNDIIHMADATVNFYSTNYVPQVNYLFDTLAHYQSTTQQSNSKPYSPVAENINLGYPGEQKDMDFMKQHTPQRVISTTHTIRTAHHHDDLGNTIKRFFTTRGDDHVPIFGHSIWWYLQYPLRPCDTVNMAYHSCTAPNYSTGDALLLMFYVWLGMAIMAWITGLALPNFVKWPVLGFAFLIFRYNYVPRCLPVLPLCLITDLQYMFTDAVPRCLCELVPALVFNYDKCTPDNCWHTDNQIRYRSCPSTELGILNPLVLLLKWKMPALFVWLFSSWWSPFSVMQDWPTVQHYIIEVKDNVPESPLDRTCAMLGLFDIILVVVALRITLSMLPSIGKSTFELLLSSWAMFIVATPVLEGT